MALSTRDKEKPFILMGAVAAGLAIQRVIGEAVPALIHVTEIGVFLVILAVMLPIELTDVGQAARRVKPTALAVFINFVFIPLFAWAAGWLILRRYPDFWVGAILYTLTPCIGWYLIFTDVAKGNVAWGIALLPWNVALQVLLLPLYLYLLVGKIIPIDLLALARSVGLSDSALRAVVRDTPRHRHHPGSRVPSRLFQTRSGRGEAVGAGARDLEHVHLPAAARLFRAGQRQRADPVPDRVLPRPLSRRRDDGSAVRFEL